MAVPFYPPPTLVSHFALTRPTAADIDALARIYYDSFSLDPGNTYWWSPDKDAMFTWMHSRILCKMQDPSVRHYQVVDISSWKRETVAFARWDIPDGYEEEFGKFVSVGESVDVSEVIDTSGDVKVAPTVAPTEEMTSEVAESIDIPKGAAPELCRGFFGWLGVMSEKWGAKDMLGLSLLCTAPNYHRQGAAKALVEPMLAIADRMGLRCYLEATESGRPMYEKLGFGTVDVKDFDLPTLTSDRLRGTFCLSIMIREPKSPE
ncbi:hypothetical protein F5Y18DRAFT_339588 [Xylariaceae sp. FL1019]|nr:hypothetical protein F5Y18DRAFT_339588 [Xylariaceae sp. FL1019]